MVKLETAEAAPAVSENKDDWTTIPIIRLDQEPEIVEIQELSDQGEDVDRLLVVEEGIVTTPSDEECKDDDEDKEAFEVTEIVSEVDNTQKEEWTVNIPIIRTEEKKNSRGARAKRASPLGRR